MACRTMLRIANGNVSSVGAEDAARRAAGVWGVDAFDVEYEETSFGAVFEAVDTQPACYDDGDRVLFTGFYERGSTGWVVKR